MLSFTTSNFLLIFVFDILVYFFKMKDLSCHNKKLFNKLTFTTFIPLDLDTVLSNYKNSDNYSVNTL
jgi:hypothetical protein